ncbi:MAG: hypothetical protein K2X47_12380, partial [Bdellovibrionales bacterium]|nr:hypothetical protein [Bdellovibrionales bacterium]
FGSRKHFVYQWMAFDPGPLRRLDFSSCAKVQKLQVRLDPEGFAKRVGYTCPLYRSQDVDFQIEYTSPQEFAKCARTLPEGSYVFFLVPEPWYMKKYGKVSGPMGLVHGEILKIEKDLMTVYNASLNSSKVESYPLQDVLEKGLKGFAGLVLFEIDPAWNWRAPAQPANAFDLSCEAKLIASGSRKAANIPGAWEDHQRRTKK